MPSATKGDSFVVLHFYVDSIAFNLWLLDRSRLCVAHGVAGESYLRKFETQPGFPVLLLQLVGSGADAAVCVSGAVFFKNYVKRNWAKSDDAVRTARIHVHLVLTDLTS